LTWKEAAGMVEDEVEVRLYGRGKPAEGERPKADPVWIHTELKKAGVTLELLHLEYLQEEPNGYRYTQFCEHFRQWLDRRRFSMRQRHVAGERASFGRYSRASTGDAFSPQLRTPNTATWQLSSPGEGLIESCERSTW
jgi:hypothetical protein